MGPLSFSANSHRFLEGRDLPISDESEAEWHSFLEKEQFAYLVEPFALGDVSFHLGWTYHRAGPNTVESVSLFNFVDNFIQSYNTGLHSLVI